MAQIITHRAAFIRTVAQAAGVKVLRVSTPGIRGRFGWLRIENVAGINELVRSRGVFRTEDEAFADAHKYFSLRAG